MKVKAVFLAFAFLVISATGVMGKFSGKSFHLAIQQQIVPVLSKFKDTDVSKGLNNYWKQTQQNCQAETRETIQFQIFEKQLARLEKCMIQKNKEEFRNSKDNFYTYAIQSLRTQMQEEITFGNKKEAVKRKIMFASQITKKRSGSFLA